MSISAACCSIPPIIAKGYAEKGSYKDIAGLKTYVTGPPSAKNAILVVFDIFGFSSQTLQGADILALSDKNQPYRVYVPDFFQGKAADVSWYPPTTKEHEQALGNFFASVANPARAVARIPGIVDGIKTDGLNVENVLALGMCWGGKVITLTSGQDTSFKAVAQAHPAMLDPEDAKNVTIPMAVLASGDEDAKDVASFKENLKVPKYVETFGDQIHGWMATRADLEDANVSAKYKKGYQTVLDFFSRQLSGTAIDETTYLVALWSLTSPTAGSKIIEFVGSIKNKALKDGNPYLVEAKAGATKTPLTGNPSRAQGYNVTMVLGFKNAADVAFWSQEDPVHKELVSLATDYVHRAPIVTVFTNNDSSVKQGSEVGA